MPSARFIFSLSVLTASYCSLGVGQPLALDPSNPHYFRFGGHATVLVTSGEHYGSVINKDFDYVRYLNELHRNRLNLTRIWVGPYREIAAVRPAKYVISKNTLAPEGDAFIAPWARTPKGGSRFDLHSWNQEYFARLKDFVSQAENRGIVVEVNLFCAYYTDELWEVSPLNSKNNVNGIGGVPRQEALTLKHPEIVAVEDALVRKIVETLQPYGNIYYEICNEPYHGDVPDDWQRHISQVIASAESGFRWRHLISQNVSDFSKKVEHPDSNVSIFNFHYSRPPESVAMNYGLDRAIGYNETGFDGKTDAAYRMQGWSFLVAGGALYNNLDYSFAVGHENGNYNYPSNTPGGGSAALRDQLGILLRFFQSVELEHMRPQADGAQLSGDEHGSIQVLADAGKEYVIYVHHARIDPAGRQPQYLPDGTSRKSKILVTLPQDAYRASWLDTKTGSTIAESQLRSAAGKTSLESPTYSEDIVLRIRSVR